MSEHAPIAAVILAAGKGTRMKSDLPKVLHAIAGRSMLQHVLSTVDDLAPERKIVVVGQNMSQVAKASGTASVVVQDTPMGTGHAVLSARNALQGFEGTIFILFADTPLVTQATFQSMREICEAGAGVVVLGFRPDDPAAYGRLITNNRGELDAIIEYNDADESQRAVTLCNAGLMAVDSKVLFELLDRVGNDNAKGEYYLTDIVGLARSINLTCGVTEVSADEVIGINSRSQLAEAEKIFQDRYRTQVMDAGVTLRDPSTVYFCADTTLGRDVTIGQNVVFGPGVVVEDNVEIRPFCHIEGTHIAAGATVGPFARLRPGAEIGADVHVGNFVEIKNAIIEPGAKVNHLSYIGDAFVGSRANIGAGTITCNYDGFNKYLTVIEEDVFIGSNTALVAPVRVGKGSNTGAGSVITQDLKSDALGVTRAAQRQIEGWAAKYRNRKSSEKGAGKWPKPDPSSVKKDS